MRGGVEAPDHNEDSEAKRHLTRAAVSFREPRRSLPRGRCLPPTQLLHDSIVEKLVLSTQPAPCGHGWAMPPVTVSPGPNCRRCSAASLDAALPLTVAAVTLSRRKATPVSNHLARPQTALSSSGREPVQSGPESREAWSANKGSISSQIGAGFMVQLPYAMSRGRPRRTFRSCAPSRSSAARLPLVLSAVVRDGFRRRKHATDDDEVGS